MIGSLLSNKYFVVDYFLTNISLLLLYIKYEYLDNFTESKYNVRFEIIQISIHEYHARRPPFIVSM